MIVPSGGGSIWPSFGRILVEREVSTVPVIEGEVAAQDAAHVPFAEDENVIQTLGPDRADQRRYFLEG
jgi:hypothetical protein